MSRLGYFVQFSDGSVLTPTESGLVLPHERLVQQYLVDTSTQLVNQKGAEYEILVVGDFVIDHTTLSTTEMRRAKEALVLYVDGDVSTLSFDAIATVLQAQFQGGCSVM